MNFITFAIWFLLIALAGVLVWQLVLLVRDIVRKIKAHKIKKAVNNPSDNTDGRKE